MALVVFAYADLVIDDSVGIGLDVFGSVENLFQGRCGDALLERFKDSLREGGNYLCQLIGQIFSVADQRWFVALIHPAFEPHFAEHHLRALGKVFVHGNRLADGVGDFLRGLPRRALWQFADLPLAQDHGERLIHN